MLNISSQDQRLLVVQSQLKKLENNTYLQDEYNENFVYIKAKFFQYEPIEKAKLLNIGCGMFSTVSDVFAFFTGNPDYDFGVSMDQFVRDLTTLGFCTMGIERVDGELQLIYQPAKNYWCENGIDKISRLYTDDDDNYYVLVQTYTVGYIENKLYIMNGSSLNGGKEVALDTIPQTTGLEPLVSTGLTSSALLVVNDNDVSIVEKIKSLVYAVDRQVVMNHTQFLQNLESFILFKNIQRPTKLLEEYEKGVRIDFSKVGRILNGSDDSSVEFVNNVNSLISEAIVESDNYIRRISAISTIPVEFLGLESKEGAVGEGSRTLRHGAFIKRIQYIRDLLDVALLEFLSLAGKSKEQYKRPEIITKTDKEIVDELKIARDAMIISQFSAIKKYGNFTDKEAQEELDLIEGEGETEVVETVVDPNTLPLNDKTNEKI